jgi:ferredoxin
VSEADQPAWRVCVLGVGAAIEFAASPRSSLIVSASRAGLRLPVSCRNGSCRACMCKLMSGRIDYLIEWPGLLAEEKAEGWILPCVALPRSDLVIHQPAARQLALD